MKIWSTLHHPNVLPLIGFHISSDLDTALIVCPLEQRGNVRDYLRREGNAVSDSHRLELVRGAHD